MAALSYTLYDYVNVTPELVGVPTRSSLTDAVLTVSTNGPFPNGWSLNEEGEWEGGELDGQLNLWIDGIWIGRAFFGPPGSDSVGYFEDTDGGSSVVSATIPRDVWRAIIADGQMQVEFGLGLDAGSLARADDYIRVDASWTANAAMVWGTEDADNIDAMEGPVASIHALGGNDYVTGSLFADQILGDDGNDTLFGAEGNDRVSGNGGNDEVSGGEGNDIVLGNVGNDNLFGDTDNDQVRGGDGLDNLSGGQGDDFLWGGADRDWLYGDDGTDRLWGEAGNDDLDGGRGTDYLFGGEGDDRLLGGKGENHLFGGTGADEFVFAFADGISTQRVYDFSRAEGDKVVYIQDFDQVVDTYDIRVGKDGTVLEIDGTTIVLSGVFNFTQDDIVFQWDSNWPFLIATSAATLPTEVVRGTDGHDELTTGGPAIMFGLGGDDWLTGSDGDDIMMGGDGEDQIEGLEGNNIIRGEEGADLIGTGSGDDTISAGGGNDLVYAGGGNDRVVGGADDDHMMGGLGDDLLWGEADRDWLVGDDGSDRLWGGAGDDWLYGSGDDDFLWGGDGNDMLHGGQGDNHLFGGAGRDNFVFNSTDSGTYHIYDFDRSAGEQLFYNLDFDDYADRYDLRVGKDGTVITVLDATIILSGVFDFQPGDLVFGIGAEWPV